MTMVKLLKYILQIISRNFQGSYDCFDKGFVSFHENPSLI